MDSTEGEINLRLFQSGEKTKHIEPLRQILEILIPDLSKLSWAELIELQHYSSIQSYREKLKAYENTVLSGKFSIDTVRKDLETALWDIVTKHEPRPILHTIKTIASNAPLPILVNPFAIISDARDLKHEFEEKRNSVGYFS
jgi:hypothetical protein